MKNWTLSDDVNTTRSTSKSRSGYSCLQITDTTAQVTVEQQVYLQGGVDHTFSLYVQTSNINCTFGLYVYSWNGATWDLTDSSTGLTCSSSYTWERQSLSFTADTDTTDLVLHKVVVAVDPEFSTDFAYLDDAMLNIGTFAYSYVPHITDFFYSSGIFTSVTGTTISNFRVNAEQIFYDSVDSIYYFICPMEIDWTETATLYTAPDAGGTAYTPSQETGNNQRVNIDATYAGSIDLYFNFTASSAVLINGSLVVEGSITADRLRVNRLESVGNGGTVTTGTLEVDATSNIHSAGKTTYSSTTAGFWLGYDSTTYKFNIGNASNYLKWTGSGLQVNGQLVAGSGSSINGSYLTGSVSANLITTGTLNASLITVSNLSANSITTGTLNASVVSVINLNAANISTGFLSADRINTNSLNANKIVSGTITAQQIETNLLLGESIGGVYVIKVGSGASSVTLSADDGVYGFWVGGDTSALSKLKISLTGDLTTSGSLTATGTLSISGTGTIAGWSIDANSIYNTGISLSSTSSSLTVTGTNGNVTISPAGIVGTDSTLGVTFNLPTNGDPPTFSSGIIELTKFKLQTSAVIQTSESADTGVKLNSGGIFVWDSSNNNTIRINTNGSFIFGLNDGSALTGNGISWNGSTFTIKGAVTMSAASEIANSQVLTVNGSIAVNGNIAVSGSSGYIELSGSNSYIHINMGTSAHFSVFKTTYNSTTSGVWMGVNGGITYVNIGYEPGGSFDSYIKFNSSTGLDIRTPKFRAGSSGSAYFDINGSAVNIVGQSVSLNATSSLTLTGSTLAINSSGNLALSGASITLSSSSTIAVNSGTAINIAGGSLNVTSGSIAISSSGQFNMTSGTMTISSGTVNISTPNFNIDSGAQINIANGGDIILNSEITWPNEPGQIIFNSISTGRQIFLHSTLSNTQTVFGPSTSGYANLYIGSDSVSGTTRWQSCLVRAVASTSIDVGSTSGNSALFLVYPTEIRIGFYNPLVGGSYVFNTSEFRSFNTGAVNIGSSSVRFNTGYFNSLSLSGSITGATTINASSTITGGSLALSGTITGATTIIAASTIFGYNFASTSTTYAAGHFTSTGNSGWSAGSRQGQGLYASYRQYGSYFSSCDVGAYAISCLTGFYATSSVQYGGVFDGSKSKIRLIAEDDNASFSASGITATPGSIYNIRKTTSPTAHKIWYNYGSGSTETNAWRLLYSSKYSDITAGMMELPNGFIMEWGISNIAGNSTASPSLRNNAYIRAAGATYVANSPSLSDPATIYWASLPTTSVTIYNGDSSTQNINWWVIYGTDGTYAGS